MEFQLSPDGVSPSPSIVEAITKMHITSDHHADYCDFGMLNFLARFCPNVSDIV